MSEGDMLIIRVPGSTANLGPGFDSIGLALNLYLQLEVETSDYWQMEMKSKELEVFPKDEQNYVIQIALQTAAKYQKKLTPCKIRMTSDIPLARGLGSSAAAIIAGIELANIVGNLDLSTQEKLEIAAEIEGHPDNVGASLFGGLVIGSQQEHDIHAVVYRELDFDVIAAVPQEELLTKDSRDVLPAELPFSEAVRAGAIGNVFIASLLKGDYQLAGKMMKDDLYHQPYRRQLVPHLQMVEELAYEAGAYGVALSGAGPTVICLCEKGEGQRVLEMLEKRQPEMVYYLLNVDQDGVCSTIQKRV